MSQSRTRPLRNLAAWGYESSSTGDRVEVDVWTINAGETDTSDAVERAEDAFGGRVAEVLEAYGNVARVRYAGAAGVGYRYIDMAETNPGKDSPGDATQQAFAGAKRQVGGSRDTSGRVTEGYSPPEDAPSQRDCVRHGETKVLPVARAELLEIGTALVRTPNRDEENEPVGEEPFEGFKNVIRVFPNSGDDVYRYEVNTNTGIMKPLNGGPAARGA